MSGKKLSKLHVYYVHVLNAECRNSACGERIFIIRQAPLELHLIDKSGEGQNEIYTWCLTKRLESLLLARITKPTEMSARLRQRYKKCGCCKGVVYM